MVSTRVRCMVGTTWLVPHDPRAVLGAASLVGQSQRWGPEQVRCRIDRGTGVLQCCQGQEQLG